jgi:ribosomal protein S2
MSTKEFSCKICGQAFFKKEMLGGHMAQFHPKKSEKYSKMLETRDRRAFDREMHKKAKQIIEKKRGKISKQFAHQVTALKKKMLASALRESPRAK